MAGLVAVVTLSCLWGVWVSNHSLTVSASAFAFPFLLPALALVLALALADGIEPLLLGVLGGLLCVPRIPLLLGVSFVRIFTKWRRPTLAISKGAEPEGYNRSRGLVQVSQSFHLTSHLVEVCSATFLAEVCFGGRICHDHDHGREGN